MYNTAGIFALPGWRTVTTARPQVVQVRCGKSEYQGRKTLIFMLTE